MGLTCGRSVPLQILDIEGKGQGVVAKAPIAKGSYVTDYKYESIHTSSKSKAKAEAEYDKNKEGCYILEVYIDGKRRYLDATRRFASYGRYGTLGYGTLGNGSFTTIDMT